MALFGRRKKEQRASAYTKFISFQDLLEAVRTNSGVSVTEETATSLPAVYRCVTLNCDVVSTLPVDTMTRRGGAREKVKDPFWLHEPNENQDWGMFISQAQASLELDGNFYALKATTGNGRLVGLYVLNPTAVEPDKLLDGSIIYKVTHDDNTVEVLASTAIMHVMGWSYPGAIKGLSPVAAMKEAIGLGLAAEQYGAQYFGTGATLSGVLNLPEEPGPEAIQELRDQFKRRHGGISKSHAIGILTGGATWTPLSVKPEESQFLETRRFTDVQIAHGFGVPPEYVTEAEGVKGYVTGLYARQYTWMTTGINPRLVRLERKLSALLPGDDYIRFNRNAFLAMDPQERAQFYNQGLLGRWIVPNEIREKEDKDPLPGGDDPLWSVQWQPVE